MDEVPEFIADQLTHTARHLDDGEVLGDALSRRLSCDE